MSSSGRAARAMEILSEALELGPAERGEFLDQACGDDPDLRAEVDELLAEESALEDGFLEVPVASAIHLATMTLTAEVETRHMRPPPLPEQLGPYKVGRQLGWGGMGSVYLGEQEEPVQRKVALKVLDAIHSKTRRKRFAAECQALARLHHPNIASLFEVGSTGDGRSFVVMEFVDGAAITEWCDERRLGLRERIELFFGVCAGVRHAHEKGLLHRDLKPSNVLVTEVDGRPTAKVIDFGIARAVDEPLVHGTVMTLDDQLLGSPAYMSPEAARFGQRDLDTRSDVYSLGLLLYELLVGVLPFDPQEESLSSLLKRITEEDSPVPSIRLGRLAPKAAREIASRRRTSVQALIRQVRGDLDAIVWKATSRDRERRYSSPSDLAADLERHLENEPVEARPLSTPYVLSRFVRRHARLVLFGVILVVALIVGVLARERETRRANLEAERANQEALRAGEEARRAKEALAQTREVSSFLVELFELADPERRPGEPVDVHELLALGAARLEEDLQDQPLVRARLLQTIAEIYTKLADLEKAEDLVRQALALRGEELPPDHPDVISSVNELGVIYRQQGRLDEAEPLLRRVLETRLGAAEQDPVAIALAYNNLGNLFWSQRRYDEAADLHQRALEIRRRELGGEHPDVADSLNNYGAVQLARGRYREANEIFGEAAELFARLLGQEHPRHASSLYNLALSRDLLGLWTEAEDPAREALRIREAQLGAGHPQSASARNRLARILGRLGRTEEAAGLYRRTLSLQQGSDATERALASTWAGLGITLGHQGEYKAAQEALERAFDLNHQALGEDHLSTVSARSNLSWLAWRSGRPAEAEAGHRRVLELREQSLGPEHRSTAWTLHYLALALVDQGRDAEAEPLLRRALQIREKVYDGDHFEVGETWMALADLAERAGRRAEARAGWQRARDLFARFLPPEHPDLRRVVDALASTSPVAAP